jgi:uncharacterized protein (DUF427 family)
MNKPIKTPDAGHPITITPTAGRIIVTVAGRVIANTKRALTLKEASYAPVQYLPREDADMSLLTRSDLVTYCPYKGDCTYYSIPAGGERAVNAVWTYEDAYPAVTAIKGHLAFYPDRVGAIEMVAE